VAGAAELGTQVDATCFALGGENGQRSGLQDEKVVVLPRCAVCILDECITPVIVSVEVFSVRYVDLFESFMQTSCCLLAVLGSLCRQLPTCPMLLPSSSSSFKPSAAFRWSVAALTFMMDSI